MTALYGSKKVPEALFGEDTKELAIFYKALFELAPGACKALGLLKKAWQPYALEHAWIAPDYHHIRVPVMQMIETQIEVDELDHSKFMYRYGVNEGSEKGLSLIANVTHSIDAWVLRTLVRRCNYDVDVMWDRLYLIQDELLQRNAEATTPLRTKRKNLDDNLLGRIERWKATGIADIAIVPYLTVTNVAALNTRHLRELNNQINQIVGYAPFPILCVHDEFKCHPNHMNQLRYHYREILAQLAESDLLEDILTQVTGTPCSFEKLSDTLAKKIRGSNYAIC